MRYDDSGQNRKDTAVVMPAVGREIRVVRAGSQQKNGSMMGLDWVMDARKSVRGRLTDETEL